MRSRGHRKGRGFVCCKRKQTNINKNISKTQAHERGHRKGVGLKRKRKGAREKGGVKTR